MTSWHERANWLLEAVGIDDVLRSTDRESMITVTDLKWMIVAAETDRDGVPFVWIDDAEINPQKWRWRASLDVPNLLIRPNEYHGVTPSTWRQAVCWLQEFTTRDLSHVLPATSRHRQHAT